VTDPGYDVHGTYRDGNCCGDAVRIQRLGISTFETPIRIKITTTAIAQAEALIALSHHSPTVARVASDNIMLSAVINALGIRREIRQPLKPVSFRILHSAGRPRAKQ
jgi:hypothetical protein